MTAFEYGPVEIYLIGFSGERPGPDLVDSIRSLVRTETVNLLDLLFVSKAEDGSLTVVEIDEVTDDYGISDLKLTELGLAGEEDVEGLAENLPAGTSAAVLVVEHVWVKEFTQALSTAGGTVLQTERIPAAVVNQVASATALTE